MNSNCGKILFLICLCFFFFIFFANLSSAYSGTESIMEMLQKAITDLKAKVLELQKQLIVLMSKNKTEEIKSSKIKIPSVLDGELNVISSGVSNEDDYYEKFIGSISDVGFSENEFKSIKKDKNGRPYTLEELFKQAVAGASMEDSRSSFQAWKNLDEKSLEKIKKMPVNQSMLALHKSMAVWYKYHAQTAQQLSGGNFSKEELADLYSQHLKNIETYAPEFKGISIGSEKFYAFNFIKTAYAALYYHFGGMVLSWADVCTTGIAIIVGPPRGGLLWIYYAVWTANPYLWKNLSPGAYVLGKALWGPGVCNKGVVTYPIGSAQILYFGSSPL